VVNYCYEDTAGLHRYIGHRRMLRSGVFPMVKPVGQRLLRRPVPSGCVLSEIPERFTTHSLGDVANADVLVSWNFKHIVRLEKIRIFNAVNLELGYKSLQIHSPQEVASYE
jgi:hypothetical protein